MANISDLGITYIPTGYETGTNLYTGLVKTKKELASENKRMEASLKASQRILNEQSVDLGLTTNPFRISTNARNLFETEEALGGLFEGQSIVTYDTENLGTAVRGRFPGKEGVDFFAITEFSFQRSKVQNGKFVPDGDAFALNMALPEDVAKTLSEKLNELEGNPTALFGMDDQLRRSLADLTLYDDTASFGSIELGNSKYFTLTGQSKGLKPSIKGTALAEKETIARMRQGLRNWTDPKKVNQPTAVVDAIANILSDSPRLIGHNVNAYDQGNVSEFLRGIEHPQKENLLFQFSKPQLDSLPLAQKLFGLSNESVPNFQLSTLFDYFSKSNGKKQAHFSAADVAMNTEIFNGLLEMNQKIVHSGGVGQPIQNGKTFFAEKGLGYNASDFNRHAGQYDMTLVKDKKTGQYVQRRAFQEATLTAGHSYQLIGQYEKVDINGVEHYAMQLEDTRTQTRKIIYRESRSELAGIFDEQLKPVEAVTNLASRQDFHNKDQARRAYESLFDPKMRWENDTIAKRYESAKKALGRYQTERDALVQSGYSGSDLKHQAITRAEEILNKNRDDANFYTGYENIEKMANMEGTFMEEMPFWDAVIQQAPTLSPSGSKHLLAQQRQHNLFIHNIYDQTVNAVGRKDQEYGYEGMRRLPVVSAKGEITHYNVESPQAIQSKLRQTLYKKGYSNSHVMRDFEIMLRDLRGTMSASEQEELKKRVRQELQSPNGQVSQTLVNDIAAKLYDVNVHNQDVVSSIPGLAIYAATPDGSSQRGRYMNQLVSNKSRFFQEVIQSATEQTKARFNPDRVISNVDDFDIFRMSEEAGKRIKTSEEVGRFLDQQAGASQQLFKMKHKNSAFTHLDHNAAMKGVLKSFEDQGFATELVFFEEKGEMALFFTEGKNRSILNNMSTMDKINNPNVKRLTMPLMNTDGTVSINGTRIVNRYKASFSSYAPGKQMSVSLTSTQDRAFEELFGLAKQISDEQKTNAAFGKPEDFAGSADKRIASYNHRMIDKQIARGYPGDIGTDKPYGQASILKNFNSGRQIDISELGDEMLKKYEPETYRKYAKWKKETNYKGAFINSDYRQAGIGKIKNAITFKMDSEFNGLMKNHAGLRLSFQGTKAKQMMAGIAVLGETRGYTPFGLYNATERENIAKVYNYHRLEEDTIRSGLRGMELSEAAIDRRLAPSITQTGLQALAFDNFNEISSVGTDAMMMDDFSLKNRLTKAKENIKVDLAKAERELHALQAKGAPLKDLQAMQDKVRDMRIVEDELAGGLLSHYEGQSIVDRRLLSSYEMIDDMNVKLRTGEVYGEAIQKKIAEATGIKISGGKLNYLPTGEVRFDKPIGAKELEDMKLLKDGRLTIGGLVEASIDEKTGELVENMLPGHSYAFNEFSEVLGIQNNDGVQSLIVRNKRKGQNGTKLIETNFGMRTTAVGAHHLTLEYITGQKGIQAIVEEMNPERKQYGGLTSVVIQTNAQAIVDNMEAVAAGKGELLKGTEAWFNKSGFTVSDLNKVEVQRQALNEVFLPHLKGFGVESANWFKNTSSMVLPDADKIEAMTNGRGTEALKTFTEMMVDQFGFQTNRVRLSLAAHDVSEYETKARYSLREFQLLREKLDNGTAIFEKLEGLTDTDSANAHTIYGRKVARALNDWDELSRPGKVMQPGNVIFDMAGQYATTGEANFVQKDGVFIVDGTSLKAIPDANNRSRADEIGTMADPMSVRLYDKEAGFDKTLGEVLEEQQSKAYLKTQGKELRWFSKDYVPIVGNLMEKESLEIEGNQPRVIQKNFETIFTASQELNQRKTVGNLTPEQDKLVQAKIARLVANGQTAVGELHDSMGSYLLSTGKGDFNKGTMTVKSKHGFSAVIGSYNPLEQFEGEMKLVDGELQTNWKENGNRMGMGEMITSRQKAEKAIFGLEENILMANNIDDAHVIKALDIDPADLSDTHRREYILNMMQYGPGKGERDLDVFVPYNRQPSQAMDSIQFLSLKVSTRMTEEKDHRMLLGLAAAAGSNADNDGDHGYAMLDLYSGKETKEHLLRMQGEMRHQNESFVKRGQSASESILNDLTKKVFNQERKGLMYEERLSQNALEAGVSDTDWLKGLEAEKQQEIADRVSREAMNRMQNGIMEHQNIVEYSFFQDVTQSKELFKPRNDLNAEALFKSANMQAGVNIGLVDNTVVGGRNLLYYVASQAMENKDLDVKSFKNIMGNYDKQGSILIQKLISSKKIKAEDIGYLPDAPDADNMNAALRYLEETFGISKQIRSLDQAGVPDLVNLLVEKNVINGDNPEEMAGMTQAFQAVAYANEATKDFHGLDNSGFDIKSAGKANSTLVRDLISQPQAVLGTEQVKKFAEGILEPAEYERALTSFRETGQRVGSEFATLYKTGGRSIESLMGNAKEQIAELTENSFLSRAEKRSKTSAMVDMLADVGASVSSSRATAVGLGFGAAWMLGSAIKGGPTPEGNEAQQEATPVEVNPAALLTSPTARVTPNRGENIRLSVSGSGNVSEADVSGLINQEISGMTGMQMNMNINVTDNTQTLDRSFYEQAINRALGF